MTRTVRYRALAALSASLLVPLFLILGCSREDQRQNDSSSFGEQSTVPGPGAQHDPRCKPSWSKVPSARELRDPRAIAATAENDVWIVGSGKVDREAGGITTGAEHWDGSSWTLVPTPNPKNGDNVLNGADALAGDDVWAVGYSKQDQNRYETLAEHWNGARWQAVKSPNVYTSQYNTLTSVEALSSTNAWAVGSYRSATSRKTLIQRWDGTTWSIVSSPNPGTLGNSLLGVAAAGPDDIWAVGWKSSGDGLRSLVLRYDGTRWKEITVPTVGTEDNVLTGISAVGAKDVWATGYYVDGAQHKTLTLHHNGTAWSRVVSPNAGDGISILRDIGTFSSTNAWAVGFEYRSNLHHYVASTQHWDGSTWSAVPSAISEHVTKDSEMLSVAKAPGTSRVWAVGSPARVESICPSGSLAAMVPAQDNKADAKADAKAGASSGKSAQPPEQPRSVPEESSVPNATVTPRAGGMPVRATDKAIDAGIHELTTSHGAVVADFNNDRSPDIFLGRHGEVARLYINDGSGHFTETGRGTFVETDRHRCDAADVNGDGLKDIFCSTGAARGTAAKRNELYVQRPDHTFVDRAEHYGVFDPFGRGRLGAFINANDDARPDLFVVNEGNRGDGMPSPNRFFINAGGEKYRYAPEYGLEREMSAELQGSAASVSDFDKDGWEDLILATDSGLRVYHNDRGNGFTDVAESVGLGQHPKHVTLADVNGDSWPDAIEVSRKRLRVFLNRSGRFGLVFSTTLQYGSSVAAGDVNGDDRADLYVMQEKSATGTNAPDQVYLNDGNGTGFTQMSSVPSTSKGGADFVAPIDYDGNGLTDFLVLNGAESSGTGKGPVQLIAFFPAS